MRDEGGIMVPVGEVEGEGEVAVVVGVVAVVVMVVVEEGAFLSVLWCCRKRSFQWRWLLTLNMFFAFILILINIVLIWMALSGVAVEEVAVVVVVVDEEEVVAEVEAEAEIIRLTKIFVSRVLSYTMFWEMLTSYFGYTLVNGREGMKWKESLKYWMQIVNHEYIKRVKESMFEIRFVQNALFSLRC